MLNKSYLRKAVAPLYVSSLITLGALSMNSCKFNEGNNSLKGKVASKKSEVVSKSDSKGRDSNSYFLGPFVIGSVFALSFGLGVAEWYVSDRVRRGTGKQKPWPAEYYEWPENIDQSGEGR